MLEHVLEVRDHPRFVQELARLEHGQTRSGPDVRLAGHCLEEREGYLPPDDRRRLQQALVFGREPVDARGEDRLDRVRHRHVNAVHLERPPAGTARSDENSRLHEGAHTLLEKERIALGPLDQVFLEGGQAGIGSHQRVEQCLHAGRRQPVEAELGVTGPVGPRMLILGPIRHEEHDPRRRQGVDQRVQQGLRLGIDPLHVVHHHDHGTAPTLSKQQEPDRIEGALAPLRGVQGEPSAVVDRHVEQCQQRRSYREQGLVDRDQCVRHSPGRGRRVVRILQPEVRAQQARDRPVKAVAAVGCRRALEDERALQVGGRG
jgi:hypothetical protein